MCYIGFVFIKLKKFENNVFDKRVFYISIVFFLDVKNTLCFKQLDIDPFDVLLDIS